MNVLGIDPGFALTGCAIIAENKGKQTLLYSECIETHKSQDFSSRLSQIYNSIPKILHDYHPDIAVLENLFFNTNAKTALLVGQSRGVIQLALYQNNIPIAEYTPLQIKMALTGYGRAEKGQIQTMVKQILKLPK